MDFSRLGRGDIVAAAGGVVLFLSLFLPWYSVTGNEDLCGQSNCSAFQTSTVMATAADPGGDHALDPGLDRRA